MTPPHEPPGDMANILTMHLYHATMTAVLGLLFTVATLYAAPGHLDPTFSRDGKLRFGFGGGFSEGRDMVVQPDGKILIAGTAAGGEDERVFTVVRYLADGSFDSTFGDGGVVLTNITAPKPGFHRPGMDEANGLRLQSDGKIVLAGSSRNGEEDYDFAVVRYLADGALDTSFDGDGIVTTDFGGKFEYGVDVATQPDGKIVVAGTVYGTFAVTRYNADGSLDGTFGQGGKAVLTELTGLFGHGFVAGLTLQADGRILLAGGPYSGSAQAFYLVRLNTDASYDRTFGSGGVAARGTGSNPRCTAITIQPGFTGIGFEVPDSILVAGYTNDGTREVFVVMRFLHDGTPDSSFDGDGELRHDISGQAMGSARPSAILCERLRLDQRRIIVAGSITRTVNGTTEHQSVLVRYNENGSPDTSFNNGASIVSFDARARPAAIAFSSGKILAAGGDRRFAATRFNPDGSLDSSFGQDGRRLDQIGGSPAGAGGVVIQPDGKIVVAGYGGESGARFAVARMHADGTFDTSFDGDGRVVAEGTGLLFQSGNGVALQPDGKMLVAGSHLSDAAVIRYHPEGSVDTTFAGGLATSQTSQTDVAHAIALQSDGKIVLAGSISNGANGDVALYRFNPNGTLDSTFDFDGRVALALGTGHDGAHGVAIQPDGKIVIVGYAANAPQQIIVARFNSNGVLDSTFDGDGVAYISVGSGDAAGNALFLDPAGRITVAGFSSNGTNYDFSLLRLRSDGSLDPSFGAGGKVVTALGAADDVANAIAAQPDGKIVVAGVTYANASLGKLGVGPNGGGGYALVRYLPDGTIDANYGTGGKVTFAFDSGGSEDALALALDANANAVVAGDAGQLFGVARVQSGPLATPAPSPTPTPTPTSASGLVANVSTRLPVGTGDNVLIEGFIVQGPVGSTKKIIVRALGPFLTQFGIADALANPTLEIRDGSNAVVATNNDWKSTEVGGIITADEAAEIQGSGLAPANDLESAIIAHLAPGSYTAVVHGVNNGVGTGIVDAYDMSPVSPARVANVATRGLIQPGDQLMIAGFIIQRGDVRAVIRAIGPSLSAFGINNALPDTMLQLRDVNGEIVRENDDWQSDQKGDLEATGLQPGNALEAAIVTTLAPGQYTAQVRGKPEGTGIGVVEIYFLQ